MSKQTSEYIALKGISERFNEVAKSFTDEEIKSIIKSTLQAKIEEEISHVSFSEDIQEIANSYIMKNTFNIENLIESYIGNKFK
jgi:hypothetical protein